MAATGSGLIVEGLPIDGKTWVVAARLGLVRNPPNLQEPAVRILLTESAWGGKVRFANVGLSHINLVRLNSLWRNGRLVRSEPMETVRFPVDGSAKLKVVKPDELLRMCHLRPESETGSLLESHGLHLEVQHGARRYIIPMLELFARCYGFSEYLRLQLATLPFEEALQALIARDIVPQRPNGWLVTLNMNCFNADAVFLAHLKHSPHTQHRVRRLCGAFQAATISHTSSLVAPLVYPWWEGCIDLECRVVSFWSKPGTFIVFRIDGMRNPPGPLIYLDRQNTNNVESEGPYQGEGSPSGGWRSPYKNSASPDPDSLVHTQEPSHDFAIRSLQNQAMKILGNDREVESVSRQVDKPVMRAHGEPEAHPTALSSGPGTRAGTNRPAPVSISTPVDALAQKVWSAIQAVIASGFPGSRLATWDGNAWIESDVPVSVPMLPSDVKRAHSWYYIRAEQRSRCFYWARILLPSGTVNLVEIERRHSEAGKAEEMCGVAFASEGSSEIKKIFRYASQHSGVFAGLPSSRTGTPPEVVLLRHRRDRAGTLETAIRTLLKRLGHVSLDAPTNTRKGTGEKAIEGCRNEDATALSSTGG